VAKTSFEGVTARLWTAATNTPVSEAEVRAALGEARVRAYARLPQLLAASEGLSVVDGFRAAVATLRAEYGLMDDATIVGALPVIVGALVQRMQGKQPHFPNAKLGHAADTLSLLHGRAPNPAETAALDTYFVTVCDHGMNASTFTARVITSTGSDLVSAVVGALGALKGPLHGGAPGPALDMVFEIGSASRAEAVLRGKIEAGEKLMGFGHRIYKVRDPRADVLARAAERLFTGAADRSLYELARSVEAEALKLLEEYKPGRRLQTNVEFYTALLLHGLGFDVELFTPTFAIGRVSGWIAHAFEQRRANRIIRPQSEYVGPRGRQWPVH